MRIKLYETISQLVLVYTYVYLYTYIYIYAKLLCCTPTVTRVQYAESGGLCPGKPGLLLRQRICQLWIWSGQTADRGREQMDLQTQGTVYIRIILYTYMRESSGQVCIYIHVYIHVR